MYAAVDAETLPFDDGQFDAVYSQVVLYRLPDPVRALREIRRVLRPGGRYLGIERASPWMPGFAASEARALANRAREQGTRERAIRYREWLAILKDAGMEAYCLAPVPGGRVSAPWLRRLGNARAPDLRDHHVHAMTRSLRGVVLSGVVFANNKAKRLAIRLTRWTGKSPEYVHPKHLLGDTQDNYWYLAYIAPDAVRARRGLRQRDALDQGGPPLPSRGGRGRKPRIARGGAAVQPIAAVSGNAEFFAADLERGLAVQGARFDTVVCLDLLEHVHQRDLLLTEIRRALKPGGTMLLSVPNRGTSWKRRLDRAGLFSYSDPDHKIEYTLEELEAELARNGFRIVHLHPTVYDTPLIGAIDLVGGLSLPLYRRLTEVRRRLARRYPGGERRLLRRVRGEMKLVFATEYYHPWAPGGTAWSLELLARALIARGHPVTVVTPNYGAAATEEVNGVSVVRFPFWRRLRPGAGLAPLSDHVNPLFHLLFARALVSAARRMGADLIHAQEKHALAGAFLASRRLRKPVYLSLRDFGLICPITTCLLRHRHVPADCSAGKLQRECAPDFFRQYIRGSALRRLRIRCSLGLLYMDALAQAGAREAGGRGHRGEPEPASTSTPARPAAPERGHVVYNLPPSTSGTGSVREPDAGRLRPARGAPGALCRQMLSGQGLSRVRARPPAW